MILELDLGWVGYTVCLPDVFLKSFLFFVFLQVCIRSLLNFTFLLNPVWQTYITNTLLLIIQSKKLTLALSHLHKKIVQHSLIILREHLFFSNQTQNSHALIFLYFLAFNTCCMCLLQVRSCDWFLALLFMIGDFNLLTCDTAVQANGKFLFEQYSQETDKPRSKCTRGNVVIVTLQSLH